MEAPNIFYNQFVKRFETNIQQIKNNKQVKVGTSDESNLLKVRDRVEEIARSVIDDYANKPQEFVNDLTRDVVWEEIRNQYRRYKDTTLDEDFFARFNLSIEKAIKNAAGS